MNFVAVYILVFFCFPHCWGIEPTDSPTFHPTLEPNTNSTSPPTLLPTLAPTSPTPPPSRSPTFPPTRLPSRLPTVRPTNPTADPTVRPTQQPTIQPTNPTASPTAPPSVTGQNKLFAVVGGSRCAENLYFGPQAISTLGSADGLHEYFMSTNVGLTPHQRWLQIVTNNGVTELFRIYWEFSTAKGIPERFFSAVNFGESVSYRVVVAATGQEYNYNGMWRFSTTADIAANKLTGASTACCLSSDDGLWGAGDGVINGDVTSSISFWGLGNWSGGDSNCLTIYQNGAAITSTSATKSYMYFNYETPEPTQTPTVQPTQPTSQPSSQPTTQPSRQPTSQPTQPTAQPTRQPSQHPSTQPTAQPSGQPTKQPFLDPTSQPSAQPVSQPSTKPSQQPSGQPSQQPSAQPSRRPTGQPTSQPSTQPSTRPSAQPSRQPSTQPSQQPSGKPTEQPSAQPSQHPSLQLSTQPSSRPTFQPSSQPSMQPSVQLSAQPSMQPSARPTDQPVGKPTGKPSTQPSTQPSQQPSVGPSSQPSRQPLSQPSAQPSGQPSGQPTAQPTAKPSLSPTSQPSEQPSVQPSRQPTGQPSLQPSALPTVLPSAQPSSEPSGQPTSPPTVQPAAQPTQQPISQPSQQPSGQHTVGPTEQPTSQPSSQPSALPSTQPSLQPTRQPTSAPTCEPSAQPSIRPTAQPFGQPTSQPTQKPSAQPSLQPSRQPTSDPTGQPSVSPTMQPSARPSTQPTSEPSSQPTGLPSLQTSALPSVQPSVAPTVQPSVQPSLQPSTNPTAQPTGWPSSAPSGEPSRQPASLPTSRPSYQPSSQPTARPSTRSLFHGNWETPLVGTDAVSGVYSVNNNVWTCGRLNVSLVCDLRNATTGVTSAKYNLPWKDVTDVIAPDLVNSAVLVGAHALSPDSAASYVALCEVGYAQMFCSVMSFQETTFTAISYVPFPNKIVLVGSYRASTAVTVLDSEKNTADSYVYRVPSSSSVTLSQLQSPLKYVGSFTAGTSVSATGNINSIVAGVIRTDSGKMTLLNIVPTRSSILNSAELVTCMALEDTKPDSFVAGGLQLSGDVTMHAYLLRVNALFGAVIYGTRYQATSTATDNNLRTIAGRRALSDAGLFSTVTKGMVRVDNTLYMSVDVRRFYPNDSSTDATSRSSVTVMYTDMQTGLILRQVHLSVRNGSLSCTNITSTGLFITIACQVAYNTTIIVSVLINTDSHLLFAKLPLGLIKQPSVVLVEETIQFQLSALPVITTRAQSEISRYNYSSINGVQTFPPSLAPSPQPTSQPSSHPSRVPSGQPSSSPTAAPSVSPQPTGHPSSSTPTNTYKPTVKPTQRPSPAPSKVPTVLPTVEPTVAPTVRPTAQPSERPSTQPSVASTSAPTRTKTRKPTYTSTSRPLWRRSNVPTQVPSSVLLTGKREANRDLSQAELIVGYIIGVLLLLWGGYHAHTWNMARLEDVQKKWQAREFMKQGKSLLAEQPPHGFDLPGRMALYTKIHGAKRIDAIRTMVKTNPVDEVQRTKRDKKTRAAKNKAAKGAHLESVVECDTPVSAAPLGWYADGAAVSGAYANSAPIVGMYIDQSAFFGYATGNVNPPNSVCSEDSASVELSSVHSSEMNEVEYSIHLNERSVDALCNSQVLHSPRSRENWMEEGGSRSSEGEYCVVPFCVPDSNP